MPIKKSDVITGSMNHHPKEVGTGVAVRGGGSGGAGADISSHNGTRKSYRI